MKSAKWVFGLCGNGIGAIRVQERANDGSAAT